MTTDQLRLLAELDDWLILGIAADPTYWIGHLRDSQRGSTARDREWWDAHLGLRTYRWGIAMTTAGDYLHDRKASDPAHAVTLTWRQITRWAESLPAELRAEVRRAHTDRDQDIQQTVLDRLLGRTVDQPHELTLF